jgi:hypothetical protein
MPTDMRVRCLIMAASVLAAATFFADAPAAAQGGLACAYGPASYQRCCAQSYKKKPRLGASARASDIDACMSGGKAKKKKSG